MDQFVELDALAKVVVAGLVIGAGLPALFALGVRTLVPRRVAVATTGEGEAAVQVAERPGPLRLAGAVACFAVVLLACLAGVVFIASGGH